MAHEQVDVIAFAVELPQPGLEGQAACAIDPNVTASQREFASEEVVRTLGRLPDPAAVSRLAEVPAAEW